MLWPPRDKGGASWRHVCHAKYKRSHYNISLAWPGVFSYDAHCSRNTKMPVGKQMVRLLLQWAMCWQNDPMTTRSVSFARCHHLRTLLVCGSFAHGLWHVQFSVSRVMRVMWELSLVQDCRGSLCRGAVDVYTCKWFPCLESRSISLPSIRQTADYVSHSFAKTGFTFSASWFLYSPIFAFINISEVSLTISISPTYLMWYTIFRLSQSPVAHDLSIQKCCVEEEINFFLP